MPEHITEWLGAYLDGELHGSRLQQVEQHLAECPDCLAELEGMQALSSLLHETAPAGDLLPTERFVTNLTLNLPRQPERSQPHKFLEIGWWLMPVGLLGTWLFIQISSALTDVALFVADAGLLGSNLAWLRGNPPQMEWFASALGLFGSQIGLTGQVALSVLNEVHLFLTQAAGSLLPQLILAGLYLGWLAAWWLRQQRNPGNFSQN